MSNLLIFGPGYTARRIGTLAEAKGWRVTGIGRARIDDLANVADAIAEASHILSSVPPEGDVDPVLSRYGALIASARAQWIGYLSSTGVYGDTGGAWVDESASVAGRRSGRNAADAAWVTIHPEARVFRLPGIYGPGRSALDRVAEGKAHRIDLPTQVFSRVHVDDIASGVMASMTHGPAGIYNLADDLPASQNDVIEYAARLMKVPPPPLLAIDDAALSPMARAFYAENRRIANGKAKRLLNWRPSYPTWREGLANCKAFI